MYGEEIRYERLGVNIRYNNPWNVALNKTATKQEEENEKRRKRKQTRRWRGLFAAAAGAAAGVPAVGGVVTSSGSRGNPADGQVEEECPLTAVHGKAAVQRTWAEVASSGSSR